MNDQKLLDWLLAGDISIQYQVYRDLLGQDRPDLQKAIGQRGWAADFLAKRKQNGHWGKSFYNPKWISTHYTLVDLRNLCLAPDHGLAQASILQICQQNIGIDGGVATAITDGQSDVCVNGMFLNYACYFGTEEKQLHRVINFLLSQLMPDGGFNCRSNRSGAKHSSLHSSLSVLEGLEEYFKQDYQYRRQELEQAAQSTREFILLHQFYLSDRTGVIIKKDFLKLSYPRRWRYDILSALDYFQYAQQPWDDRMQAAIEVLHEKRNKDGSWNVRAKHPGQTHFDMEKAGKPSRWNTLRALRVLKHFELGHIPS